jgi:hypothetical protein
MRPPYTYNIRAGRYIGGDGKFVSAAAVRELVDYSLDGLSRQVREASRLFAAREISMARWEQAMRQTVKDGHLMAAAAARGGWARLDPAALTGVEEQVFRQLEYLRGFAEQILSGDQPLDGRFFARSDMYAQASRQTFEELRGEEMEGQGYTLERNILEEAAENCEECIGLTELGWQPIGTLKHPGSRLCLTNCRCWLEYGGQEDEAG